MIIHQVKLQDFGLYGGTHVLNLSPQPCNGFNRPIVLVRGKNGAGKTTLIEAIRLCLHGSLALGSRVSRAAYEDHLARQVHVPLGEGDRPASARVELRLDYVGEGRKRAYEIRREWEVVEGSVRENVHIREDGEELADLVTREQRDNFLRELVPPGVADLFFFDGERLHTLAENGAGSGLLAETVARLLGLDLVEQLQKDLDVYLAREGSGDGRASLQNQLAEITDEMSALERERSGLRADLRTNNRAMDRARRAIARQEQRIASEGGSFADRLSESRLERERLEAKIEAQRRRAQELAGGLMPFAVVPQMCLHVADRLRMEMEYESGVAARQVLAGQLEEVSAEVTSPEFWAIVGVEADEAARRAVFGKIATAMERPIRVPDVAEKDVILRVSAEDRQTLLNWIEQSTTQVPIEFCRAIGRLNELEQRLERVDEELQRVPPDGTLGPLVEALHGLNRELGALQKTEADLREQIGGLDYRLEQAGRQRERLRRQVVEQDNQDERIQLVGRTQLALAEYARELRGKKVALLEQRLAARFNDLCRKEDLVEVVEIDPRSFAMTLYRQGQPFDFAQLSAGERQLLAMATMWALKEVSGVPMPVVVDTPLGRLDGDHRLSVVQNYVPHAGHQVVLLVTDTEFDDEALAWLAPAISRAYQLDYDAARGRAVVSDALPAGAAVPDEVAAR